MTLIHLQLQVELERLNQAIADIHLIDGDLFVSDLLFLGSSFAITCIHVLVKSLLKEYLEK